jgi:hypothetical protein
VVSAGVVVVVVPLALDGGVLLLLLLEHAVSAISAAPIAIVAARVGPRMSPPGCAKRHRQAWFVLTQSSLP